MAILSNTAASGSSNPRQEILGVQYLRAIATIVVVIDHTAAMSSFPKYFGEDPWNKPLLVQGALGVNLFFMISGFIISTVALQHYSIAPRLSIKTFLLRRFVRIVPTMWIAILLYLVLQMLFRGTESIAPYLRALILPPVGTVNPNNIWTLRHEAIFYGLFAITFLSWRGARLFLFLWFLSPLLLAIKPQPNEPTSIFEQFVRIFVHPANLLFGIGFGIGLLWVRYPRPPFRVPYPVVTWAAVAYVDIVMCIGSLLDLRLEKATDALISAGLFGPLLLGAIYIRPNESRVGQFFGDASYSIYLFHPHFVSAQLGILSKLTPQIGGTAGVFVTVISSIAACSVVYLSVERPALSFLRKKLLGDAALQVHGLHLPSHAEKS